MKGLHSKISGRAMQLGQPSAPYHRAQAGMPARPRGRLGVVPRADGSGLDSMHKELLQEVGSAAEGPGCTCSNSSSFRCDSACFRLACSLSCADSGAQAQPGGALGEAQSAHWPDLHAHRESTIISSPSSPTAESPSRRKSEDWRALQPLSIPPNARRSLPLHRQRPRSRRCHLTSSLGLPRRPSRS
jgi:hypothetical protein